MVWLEQEASSSLFLCTFLQSQLSMNALSLDGKAPPLHTSSALSQTVLELHAWVHLPLVEHRGWGRILPCPPLLCFLTSPFSIFSFLNLNRWSSKDLIHSVLCEDVRNVFLIRLRGSEAPFLLTVVLFFFDVCDVLVVFTFLFKKREIVSKNASFHPVKLTVVMLVETGIFTVTIAIWVIFWVVIFHPMI